MGNPSNLPPGVTHDMIERQANGDRPDKVKCSDCGGVSQKVSGIYVDDGTPFPYLADLFQCRKCKVVTVIE